MIKNILFDVGNVLLDFDPERFLKEAGYTKEQQEIAMRCVFTHPLWDQLDKGTVMEKEALQEFIKADPAQEALISSESASISSFGAGGSLGLSS